jgi:hypothetical protein
MSDNKLPLEIPETEEELKSAVKAAAKVLKDDFKTFADDYRNFEKNHEEKRKKLFNGNRGRTNRRVI